MSGLTLEELEAQDRERDEVTSRIRKVAPAIGERINAAALLRETFEPVQWALQGILPEGVSILSGDPKIGKSWLVLQACVSVGCGLPLWPGRAPETRGRALYLSLEDNKRRLRRRLDTLLSSFPQRPAVDLVDMYVEWPKAEAGVKRLREWLAAHPDTRLVVIDTVSAFRDADPGKKSAYAHDYAVGEMMKPLAREFSCAVVLVMHNRKAASDDPMQRISGTQGLTGSVDNVLVLTRERGRMDAALFVDGRDIEEAQELALRLDNGRWGCFGTVAEAQRSGERYSMLRVIKELREDGEKTTPAAIARAMGKKGAAVRQLLRKMVKAGELQNIGGEYGPPHTVGHSGHTVNGDHAGDTVTGCDAVIGVTGDRAREETHCPRCDGEGCDYC